MVGSVRFEQSSASPDDLAFSGSYPDGLRGSYPGASLDRSGSFREGCESRICNSGGSTPKVNATLTANLPPLPQCLMLDPITMGDQKCTSLSELRRVLGISFGGSASAGDNAFGAAHLKPHPPVVTEELTRFKAAVLDASNKSRLRAKRLGESIDKLNRYCEALNLNKQQGNEFITNERSSGSNLLKLGAQINRNSSDRLNQRLEDRTKTVVMNRRARSLVTEIRADGTSMPVRQATAMGKDRDILRGEGSDIVAEKIRRLPTGAEAWDKKMKRKRSVGTVLSQSMDADAELKRTLYRKPIDELGPQACDVQSFRSGSIIGGSGINKLDSKSLSANANGRAIFKNGLDKVSLSRDLMAGLSKDQIVPTENNKLNVGDDSQILSLNAVTKGKGSRAPRSGPIHPSTSSFLRTSGTPEALDQPPSINKTNFVCRATNRKRPRPTGSASPPMAQWVGQRPQKISRTRRANLVSPVSNNDEVQINSEGCTLSDMGARLNTFGTNRLHQKSVINSAQPIRVKEENVSSPARLSGSHESGAGENRESRLKDKGSGSGEVDETAVNVFQNTSSSVFPAKKNQLLNKDEIRVGVRKHGKSGRGSSVSRASTVDTRVKLETALSTKPIKSTKLGSERNGSKSGRPPVKKMSDRKASVSPGLISTKGSPAFAGESVGDDREELLGAATFACNARNLACSSSFWQKMEPFFGPVRLEASYLKEQLTSVEENDECLSLRFGNGSNFLDDIMHEQTVSNTLVSGQKEIQKAGILVERLDSEGMKKVQPLYQRVLSALILEDEFEEFESDIDWRTMSLQYDGDAKRICNKLFNEDLSNVDFGVSHTDSALFPVFQENGADGLLHPCTNSFGICSFDCAYEQMSVEDRLLLELQSVGLYQETVPDLADGDDEAIDGDIVGLQKLLHQQVDGKKMQLKKFIKAVEESMDIESRHREQVAMDRLVELAYRKLLATRGSIASKYGIPKVPKQVSVDFMKRTLARCRKYEETGKSCFNEPTLRDAIFAALLQESSAEPIRCNGLSLLHENQHSQQELGVSGSSKWVDRPDHHTKYGIGSFGNYGTHPSELEFSNPGPIAYRGKKKEVLLDDVGSPSVKAVSNLGALLGRAKGKRSERERDKDISARNSVAKVCRQSLGNNKGERKTKTKPKQKTAQLSTSGNGLISNAASATGFTEVNGSNNKRKREVEPIHNNGPPEGPTETKKQIDFANLPLNELDSIELGVGNDLDGSQDLSTWLSFDEDGLQDHDAEGLDIPMDDLADLNMLM